MNAMKTKWILLGALALLSGVARAESSSYVCAVDMSTTGVVRLEMYSAPLCGGPRVRDFSVCGRVDKQASCDLRATAPELTDWFAKGIRAAVSGTPLSLPTRVAAAR